jgi:hypothetical protein
MKIQYKDNELGDGNMKIKNSSINTWVAANNFFTKKVIIFYH